MTTKEVHFITSKVIKKLLEIIYPKYGFKFEVETIDRGMVSKNAKMLGETLGDKLMAEPHKEKQIIGYEFRQASREIKRHMNASRK